MSLASISRIDLLRDRAAMLRRTRQFFLRRGIMEVDVPLLTQKAPIDCHIDLVESQCMGKRCYLQSSPEYGMKRLLSEGIGDIYQLSHVFRDGDRGERHNPEFTMVEWYRIGFSFEEMMEETALFLRLFLDVNGVETLSYKEAFRKYAHVDVSDIVYDRDIVFASAVEPHLGREGLTILKDFPPEEAALSQISEKNGERIAERFEFFYQGFELANGYHELIDPIEQRKRLEEANEKRAKLNKGRYPMDDYFLAAVEKGLPDMCGVACGFDRMMMLRLGLTNIEDVLPFSWDHT